MAAPTAAAMATICALDSQSGASRKGFGDGLAPGQPAPMGPLMGHFRVNSARDPYRHAPDYAAAPADVGGPASTSPGSSGCAPPHQSLHYGAQPQTSPALRSLPPVYPKTGIRWVTHVGTAAPTTPLRRVNTTRPSGAASAPRCPACNTL
jgi:hypothetical protein